VLRPESDGVVPHDKFCANRQFVGGEAQGFAGDGFGDPVEFKKNVAGFDGGNPIFGLAFSFTHSGFRGPGSDRLVWENPDPEFAFPLHVSGHGHTGGFDLGIGDPGSLEGLQGKRSEINLEIAGRIPGAASPLGLAILHSFWHQGHVSILLKSYQAVAAAVLG